MPAHVPGASITILGDIQATNICRRFAILLAVLPLPSHGFQAVCPLPRDLDCLTQPLTYPPVLRVCVVGYDQPGRSLGTWRKIITHGKRRREVAVLHRTDVKERTMKNNDRHARMQGEAKNTTNMRLAALPGRISTISHGLNLLGH